MLFIFSMEPKVVKKHKFLEFFFLRMNIFMATTCPNTRLHDFN